MAASDERLVVVRPRVSCRRSTRRPASRLERSQPAVDGAAARHGDWLLLASGEQSPATASPTAASVERDDTGTVEQRPAIDGDARICAGGGWPHHRARLDVGRADLGVRRSASSRPSRSSMTVGCSSAPTASFLQHHARHRARGLVLIRPAPRRRPAGRRRQARLLRRARQPAARARSGRMAPSGGRRSALSPDRQARCSWAPALPRRERAARPRLRRPQRARRRSS